MSQKESDNVLWTPQKLAEFMETLREAKEDPFMFDGKEYDKKYSKYLIELLKSTFQSQQ